MNREEYIKYRAAGRLNPIAFDYYKNNLHKSKIKLKTPLTNSIFNSAFNRFYLQAKINWQELLNYYDKKFTVTIVTEIKTNKLLKVL